MLENNHVYMFINTALLKLKMWDMEKYLQVLIRYYDAITKEGNP